MMEWHTISRVVAQHLRVCLDSGSGISPTCCASTLCVYWTGQGIDPGLIVERTMYNLTHLSRVLSTPNPWVVDEKVCTQYSLLWFARSRPITWTTYLVFWVVTLSVWPKSSMNGNHIVKIGNTLPRSFWELIVSVNLASGSKDLTHEINYRKAVAEGIILNDERC